MVFVCKAPLYTKRVEVPYDNYTVNSINNKRDQNKTVLRRLLDE